MSILARKERYFWYRLTASKRVARALVPAGLRLFSILFFRGRVGMSSDAQTGSLRYDCFHELSETVLPRRIQLLLAGRYGMELPDAVRLMLWLLAHVALLNLPSHCKLPLAAWTHVIVVNRP